jgi:outer membrane protein assembly factor BamB
MKWMFAIVSVCAAFSVSVSASDEWPEYRGRDGQGHSDAKGLPVTWSETQNVAWKMTIPGKGWSSPVVSGDEIWVTTAIEATQPEAGTPPTKDDFKSKKPGPGTLISPKPLSLRAVCVDLNKGTITKNVEALFIEQPGNIHRRNGYASPSPIIENGKLYVHFGTYGTACISTADSKVLWRNKELRWEHENGPGSTPVLSKDKILLCCDGSDVQFMAALKKDTGEIAWKTPRSTVITKGGDQRKAYGTPLVASIDGKDQVITPAADSLYSYDVETGKELWKIKYNGYSNVARPIYDGKLIYFSTGFDTPEFWAIKPTGTGELGADKVVWKEKVQAARQASPLLSGTRLYMFSDSGVVRCLDAATAKEFWRQKIGGDGAASPIVADGKVYFFDAMEGATVVEDSDTYKLLASNKLDDGFMASPAVVGKSLILRTKQSLYRVEQK